MALMSRVRFSIAWSFFFISREKDTQLLRAPMNSVGEHNSTRVEREESADPFSR